MAGVYNAAPGYMESIQLRIEKTFSSRFCNSDKGGITHANYAKQFLIYCCDISFVNITKTAKRFMSCVVL